MKEALKKAEILTEALHWIREYRGKKVVIKYGGKAITADEGLKKSVISDIVAMKLVGINPIVVHGGGPEISKYMEKVGKKPKFVDGLRITDEETVRIAKKVLVEKINREIVEEIKDHGAADCPNGLGYGISGDEGLIFAKRKEHKFELGFVGQVNNVEASLLDDAINRGLIPVIAPLGLGLESKTYNINADHVAGEVAAALNKIDQGNVNIIFLTDVDGLYKRFEDKSSLISELRLEKCKKMVDENKIAEGMLPKVKGCITALEGGVPYAHILNGARKHALLVEMFTDRGIGTMIVN